MLSRFTEKGHYIYFLYDRRRRFDSTDVHSTEQSHSSLVFSLAHLSIFQIVSTCLYTKGSLQQPITLLTHMSLGCGRRLQNQGEKNVITGRECKLHRQHWRSDLNQAMSYEAAAVLAVSQSLKCTAQKMPIEFCRPLNKYPTIIPSNVIIRNLYSYGYALVTIALSLFV